MIITHTLEDTTIENALKTFQDFYLKKDYPNAILILEKNQNSIEPGLWHYNMGTVLGEMKNWPLARYHFMVADEIGFNSKELQLNQELTDQMLEVDRLEKPFNTSDYLIKTGLIASEGPLTTIGLFFLVIGIWFLKKKRSVKRSGLFILAVGAPLILNLWIHSWPKKIVTTIKPLYDGPSALFATKGDLPAGLLVLTNTKGEWEEIIFPSRFSGWVKSDGMKKLELK